MTTLWIKFAAPLEDYSIDRDPPHGPLCHRWLPNGQDDSISLSQTDPNVSIEVWFERRGYMDGNEVKFDHDREEIDPKAITTQGVLDAGALRGLMKIHHFSKEQQELLNNESPDEEEYRRLAKKVIKTLQPELARFLSILRVNYGQYWLSTIEPFDSRSASIGHYFTLLHMQWSLNEGAAWSPFELGEKVVSFTATMSTKGFEQYITEADWKRINELAKQDYDPSLAARTLIQSYRLLDEGNLRYAFIEGVTALESAIGEVVRGKVDLSSIKIKDGFQTFWNNSLPCQLITVASLVGPLPSADIDLSLEAIKTRNAIIHEGAQACESNVDQLKGLFRVIAGLLDQPFKFPSHNSGNAIMSEEKWAQEK